MALKDKVKGFLSFLDTDDTSELEDNNSQPLSDVRQTQIATHTSESVTSSSAHTNKQMYTSASTQGESTERQASIPRYAYSKEQPIQQRRELMVKSEKEAHRVTIALKYPRTYDDAQGIVDLLVENESVLIDFQYMTDAQARRCLDFIDGASKVLFGHLNYVGSTMYLLTPANVVVNLNDLAIPESGQDLSYDYDMKRR